VIAQAAPFVGPKIDWFAFSPLIVLIGSGLLLLVAASLTGKWIKGAYAFATATAAGAAGVLAMILWNKVDDGGPRTLVSGALSLDGFSVFVTVAICVAVLLTALVVDDYLRREGLDGIEVYGLMLLAAGGGVIMAMATDLIVLFVGLEILSIALYVLAASHLKRIDSQEAGVKYFILGGFSSAFFLYGVALIFGATGSTQFADIEQFFSTNIVLEKGLLMAGLALLMVGLAFKVSAVPFHSWAPDVYQGAPSPITGFMASAGKAAAFAALLRVFVSLFATRVADWQPAILVIAILTLAIGAILAVVQTNVKRMLAYSSISHAGFMLVGVHAASERGTSGTLFYVAVYAVMVIGTFAMVTIVGRTGDADHRLSAYKGLAKERPTLALLFAIFLLAQAGTPLTSGFMAKLGVIRAATEGEHYGLAIVAMLSAAISAFLYLRIVYTMYFDEVDDAAGAREPIRLPVSAGIAIVLSLGFTLLAGVFPGWLMELTRNAIPG
jgi:NADH-quinone oxidoreductase subunit N